MYDLNANRVAGERPYDLDETGRPRYTAANIAAAMRNAAVLARTKPWFFDLAHQSARSLADMAVDAGWLTPEQVSASVAEAKAEAAPLTGVKAVIDALTKHIDRIADMVAPENGNPTDEVPQTTAPTRAAPASAISSNGRFTPEQQHVAGLAFAGAQPHRFGEVS